MKKTSMALSLASLLSFNVQATNLCSSQGYVFGFFNGVWNTEIEAALALKELSNRYGKTYNDEKVKYELFYNQSGKAESSNATSFQDIAEVFIQRANEIEPELGERFDLFWSVVTGDSDGFLDKVKSIVTSVDDLVLGLLEELYDWATSQTVKLIGELFSNPPTEDDYSNHENVITDHAGTGHKFLFFAHSQGNLFVNNAYNFAISQPNINENNVGVVHVAPASSKINGPYILANLDLVINGLRVIGPVPEVNAYLPIAHLKDFDPSGHMLMASYLANGLETTSMVDAAVVSEFARLESPVPETIVGAFTVTLKWDGSGDVDLHTFEPMGEHVYFSNKQGQSGVLDLDNTVADGPENYVASCESEQLQRGNYAIGVHNYARADGRVATLTISSHEQPDLLTRSIVVQNEDVSEGGAPTHVLDVVVTDDENGEVRITAR